MIVWSVTYKQGRSEALRRQWFETETEADAWVKSPPAGVRFMLAPEKHRIEGKAGLLSYLRTYLS